MTLALVVACGGKSKPTQLAPLPDDKPAAPVAEAPTPPPEPPKPRGPLEITLPAQQVVVKLIAKGRGKAAPLRYTAKAGGSQQVELAMDFAAKQTEGTQSQEQIIPTIVLLGTAETKAVDAQGQAEYAFTVSGADARDVAGAQVPADKFKQVLGSLVGLVISGKLGSNGVASETLLRIEKPDDLAEGALELIRITLPTFPALPTEPVGVGAKWQATTTAKLADKLTVTQVTDYELTAKKAGTFTIKGKTKITGADQDVEGGKISAIGGSGTTEISIAEGALYPTYKQQVENQFTASEKDKSMQFVLKVGGAVTAK